MRSSVCAQFADRSTSSGGGETAGTAGDSAGTGAATAGGAVAVESEGPAPPCVESRKRDNQRETREILGKCLIMNEMSVVGQAIEPCGSSTTRLPGYIELFHRSHVVQPPHGHCMRSGPQFL